MAKSKYGYMKCPTPGCDTRIVVKENERGTLSWRCDECDGTGYVKKGDAAFPKWDGQIEKSARAPAPAPAPKKEDAPKPAPAPKPAASTLLG